jgi:hypothetical protein
MAKSLNSVNRYKEFVARLALGIMELRAAAEQAEFVGDLDMKQELIDVAFGMDCKLKAWRDKFKTQLK